jgi:hypothetical protein
MCAHASPKRERGEGGGRGEKETSRLVTMDARVRRCAKTQREDPYSRAEREFLRFFSLCGATGLENWGRAGPHQSFHTAWHAGMTALPPSPWLSRLPLPRNAAKPSPEKPMSIIAQVDGSGMPAVRGRAAKSA